MSTPFDGTWTDQNGDTITVTSQDQLLTAKYSNGRGPFSGVAAEVGAAVIYVDFSDDSPGTGVMGINGDGLILWNNGTEWKQNGAKS